MLLVYFFAVIATLFAGWRVGRRLRYFLHLFQLEGYKPNQYWHWLGGHTGHIVRLSHKIALGVLIVAGGGFFFVDPFWTALVALPAWAIAFASSRLYRSHQAKKPLAYTNRLKRLLGAAVVLTLVPLVAGLVLGARQGSLAGFWFYLIGFFVADFGAPLWVLLAGFVMEPLEAYFRRGFKKQARRRLQEQSDLIVVGITGSYGKTSTKFILAEILRQRFNVLASPASYNTPMGLCLVVNNRLKPEHQVLVLEMGMRYRGDIRELCELAPPDVAVVTSVGVAHLETMGSLDNIAREKGDLLEFMKPGGTAVLNVDDERVAAMAARAPGRVWRVSTEGHADADITASDIRYGPEGASFTARDDTGDEVAFKTKLLGKHNVLNILLGVAVGREMGLRLRQIAHAVARVEPVEHRLQLRREGAVTIIDDAFNANPVGARNAVEILGQFDTGRRVVVTPGMIELGERQDEENRTFGTHIARHVDLAVLIGPQQTRPIQEGLLAEDFPEEQTKVFTSFFDAQDFLKSYLRPGDVVLYENDLPDQYNE